MTEQLIEKQKINEVSEIKDLKKEDQILVISNNSIAKIQKKNFNTLKMISDSSVDANNLKDSAVYAKNVVEIVNCPKGNGILEVIKVTDEISLQKFFEISGKTFSRIFWIKWYEWKEY